MVTASPALRAAGPADRRHRVVDRQRPSPEGRHPAMTPLKAPTARSTRWPRATWRSAAPRSSPSGSKVTVNHLNAGRIPGGATVERAVPTTVGRATRCCSSSTTPTSAPPRRSSMRSTPWPRARRPRPRRAPGPGARAGRPNQRVAFLGRLENLEVPRRSRPPRSSSTPHRLGGDEPGGPAELRGRPRQPHRHRQQRAAGQPAQPFGQGQTAVTNKGRRRHPSRAAATSST